MRQTLFGIMMVVIFTAILGCVNQKKQEPVKAPVPMSTADRPLANIPPKSRLNYYRTLPEMSINDSTKYLATIFTDKGNIVMELQPLYAPLHVNSFVFLARQGFYDGLTFHRYEPGFVIQGGDPGATGTGNSGYRIPAEIGLPHEKGSLAMARQPDEINPKRLSSGSQFYITLAAQPRLDGLGYTVFGKVVEGFEVVKKIRKGDVMIRIDIEEK